MTQEEINNIIQKPLLQKIANSEEFYFQKGQDALNKWLNLNVDDDLKEILITLAPDYKLFLKEAEVNPELNTVKKLLFEIITYCDSNARDKHLYNGYDDKRSLALAFVRMNNWVDGLVKLKFEHDEIKGASIRNAFNYLRFPQDNATILSRDHRNMIASNLLNVPFKSDSFVRDLKEYFEKFKLTVINQNNYTHLLTRIIYEVKDRWQDEVIGLMASDSTGWQENELSLDENWGGLAVWNSKKPTGGPNILKFLKDLIDDKGSFPYYYSVKGNVNYCTNVIDFAANQKELDTISEKYATFKSFHPNFSDYKDTNKSASIVFITEGIEKIKPIPITEFGFYNCHPPRQDNLSPIKNIPEEVVTISKDNPNETALPLNQILYGPPGTGKTYNTINMALEICGEDLTAKNRKEIKQLFQQYVEEGRIVFTTFHQSMTYEDFVEGIKPKINGEEESDISYEIEDGIFKLICKKAEEENNTGANNKNFDEAWAELIDDVKKSLSMDKLVKIGSWEYGLSSKESLKYSSINTPSQYSFTITKQNVYDAYRNIKARPSGAFQKDMEDIVGFMKTKFNLNDYQEVSVIEESANQNYVLIIDEINRGNVSQIFGELITLIEEDKRLGKPEALQVQLPYSKKPFGVPPNIFIIGTMNTADRSVEALDTALRRRFSFTEMPPKPELIDVEVSGIRLSTLLEMINKRIEKLLDKDHMIGHSYFLSVKDWKDLKSVFHNKIVPLLQEYFFGDYGKIGLVIGSKFFKNNEEQEDNFFAPFEDYDSSPYLERKVYHLQNIKNMEKDEFEEALNHLLGKK